jgi:hypothetical protein
VGPLAHGVARAFALDLTDDERAVVETLTHRRVLPRGP